MNEIYYVEEYLNYYGEDFVSSIIGYFSTIEKANEAVERFIKEHYDIAKFIEVEDRDGRKAYTNGYTQITIRKFILDEYLPQAF